MLVVDVEGFTDPRRTNRHQVAVRDGLYSALRTAFHSASVSWNMCHYEDRGDGVLVLVPVEVAKSSLVENLPYELVLAIQQHNKGHCQEEQIRLRMVLNAGEVYFDDHGVTAASINHAFRLLSAPEVKTALARSDGVLAVVVSTWFYDEVVRHSPVAKSYRLVQVTLPKGKGDAWVSVSPISPRANAISTGTAVLDDRGLLRSWNFSEGQAIARTAERTPRQLPAHTPYFVGRSAELQQLTNLLTADADVGSAVVISAINGTAGIGKTALALHWAHSVEDRFPDGQLYINLRGFDSEALVEPDQALERFLLALGTTPEVIPGNLDARAAMYRALLADRRMLIVLDNARDSEHVRPLVPSAKSCFVVITSRNRLDSLVAREGARRFTLDLLAADEAIALLAKRLGRQRIDAEPASAAELVELCARLPLALTIATARTGARPSLWLTQLVKDLRDERARLDALDLGDADLNLRTIFSWSYHALTEPSARLFRLLGTQPYVDLSSLAVANLAGTTAVETRASLNELTRAHLLDEHVPGRFRFHDLLRMYAAERGLAEDANRRREPVHRLLDYYLHSSLEAERHLYPYREQLDLSAPRPGVVLHQTTDYQQAMDWFAAEFSNLLIAAGHANSSGFERYAWQIPWTLATFLDRRGYWHEYAAAHQTALDAAIRLNDRLAQTQIHRIIGRAYSLLGRQDEAIDHHRQALEICRQIEHFEGQARAHRSLAMVYELKGKFAEAIVHAHEASELFLRTGNQSGQARALNLLGRCCARLGQYQSALDHCQHALRLFRALRNSDGQGEADTLDSIGYAYQQLAQHDQAISHYNQALILWRQLGNDYYEAATLTRLGASRQATGDRIGAREAWQRALEICELLNHPDVRALREQLLAL